MSSLLVVDQRAADVAWWFGVFLRLVGLLFAGACAMLVPQIKALAGHRGLQPAQARIERIRQDFGPWARHLRFPSWLTFVGGLPPSQFDLSMQVLLAFGSFAGCLVSLGWVDSWVWLFVCWSVYLSFANMVHLLIYPWDYLLLEIGFISLALPRAHFIGESLALVEAPAPLLTLYLRWLLFRLMFGFGKVRRRGTRNERATRSKRKTRSAAHR